MGFCRETDGDDVMDILGWMDDVVDDFANSSACEPSCYAFDSRDQFICDGTPASDCNSIRECEWTSPCTINGETVTRLDKDFDIRLYSEMSGKTIPNFSDWEYFRVMGEEHGVE